MLDLLTLVWDEHGEALVLLLTSQGKHNSLLQFGSLFGDKASSTHASIVEFSIAVVTLSNSVVFVVVERSVFWLTYG